jgi:hypothetical protein
MCSDEPLESGLKSEKERERMKKSLEDPVVFAVCALEAGRRVVDYYMTWRGKVMCYPSLCHSLADDALAV